MHGGIKGGPLVTVLKKEAFASYTLIKFKRKKKTWKHHFRSDRQKVSWQQSELKVLWNISHLKVPAGIWQFQALKFQALKAAGWDSPGSTLLKAQSAPPPTFSSGNRKSRPNVNQSCWGGGLLSYLYVLLWRPVKVRRHEWFMSSLLFLPCHHLQRQLDLQPYIAQRFPSTRLPDPLQTCWYSFVWVDSTLAHSFDPLYFP